MMLSYNNVKNYYQSMVGMDSDVDPDIVTEFTSVHHGCALYLYLVPILYYDIHYYLIVCYSTNTIIGDDENRVDGNVDHDLVHYGVVYTYVHVYYVVQLLLYNIQRSIGCNNSNTTNCDDNNVRYTAGLFFLLIVMEHKIDNISKINDNNFGFTHCNMMHCDYINNIHIHLYNWIPKTKKDHNTARDNNQYPTYQVHKSLF